MNKKKIFAVLMSATMMVAFMPAMAFAATKPVVTDINWNTHYTEAYVTTTSAAGGTSTTQTKEVSVKWHNGYKTVSVKNADNYNWSQTDKKYYANVCDMADAKISAPKYVDAGAYSKWYTNQTDTTVENPAEVTKVTLYKSTLKSTDYVATYPAYKAYAYNTETNKSLSGKINVALTDSFKTYLIREKSDVVFVDSSKDTEVSFYVDKFNPYYLEWGMMNGTNEFAGTYDGKTYTATVAHPAEAMTVTYAFKKLGTGTDAQKEFDKAFVAADFGTVAPSFSEVGTYKVAVQFVINKNKQNVTFDKTFVVAPKTVTVKAKTTTLTKEYDGKGFQFADSMFVIDGMVTGDALFADTELTEADVNDYYVYADKVVTNNNYTVTYNGVFTNGKCIVSITPAENTVKITTAKTKSFKATKVAKVKKTFTVKATAAFGTAKITKVSGSKKLSVKGDKIVVKKGTKKGTYKIKVKAYVAASKNFKAGSVTKTFTVKVK